jgi:hypothetical protein
MSLLADEWEAARLHGIMDASGLTGPRIRRIRYFRCRLSAYERQREIVRRCKVALFPAGPPFRAIRVNYKIRQGMPSITSGECLALPAQVHWSKRTRLSDDLVVSRERVPAIFIDRDLCMPANK